MDNKIKHGTIKRTFLTIMYTFMVGNLVYQVYSTLKKMDQLNNKGQDDSD